MSMNKNIFLRTLTINCLKVNKFLENCQILRKFLENDQKLRRFLENYQIRRKFLENWWEMKIQRCYIAQRCIYFRLKNQRDV